MGRFVFCVLFTDSHTPTNSSNKCGMYIFSFETESDRDLIGEEVLSIFSPSSTSLSSLLFFSFHFPE